MRLYVCDRCNQQGTIRGGNKKPVGWMALRITPTYPDVDVQQHELCPDCAKLCLEFLDGDR